MTLAFSERRGHLTTAGIGTALMVIMGTVLIFGFRLATHMRANIGALQTASALQSYPDDITRQLNTLRDRLQSLADPETLGVLDLETARSEPKRP